MNLSRLAEIQAKRTRARAEAKCPGVTLLQVGDVVPRAGRIQRVDTGGVVADGTWLSWSAVADRMLEAARS